MSVGFVDHEADGEIGLRVLKLSGSGQGHLGSVENLVHRLRTQQRLALKCVGEGEQNPAAPLRKC